MAHLCIVRIHLFIHMSIKCCRFLRICPHACRLKTHSACCEDSRGVFWSSIDVTLLKSGVQTPLWEGTWGINSLRVLGLEMGCFRARNEQGDLLEATQSRGGDVRMQNQRPESTGAASAGGCFEGDGACGHRQRSRSRMHSPALGASGGVRDAFVGTVAQGNPRKATVWVSVAGVGAWLWRQR